MGRERAVAYKTTRRKEGKYTLANSIGAPLRKHQHVLFRKIEALLFYWGMLDHVAKPIMGKTKSLPDMLKLISCATLRYGKPYELLGEKDFVTRTGARFLTALPCSQRTVYTLLHKLREAKLICGFSAKSSAATYKQWHIALNIGEILLRGASAVPAFYRSSAHKNAKEPFRLFGDIVQHAGFPELLEVISRHDKWHEWPTEDNAPTITEELQEIHREMCEMLENRHYRNDMTDHFIDKLC